MPEGPEIRRAADELSSALVGQTLHAVTLNHPALVERRGEIENARVTGVDCHGKAMLTHLSTGVTIYSHNQLYGVWYVVARDHEPSTNRALRLGLHTETHTALLYSATDISVWQTQDLPTHPFLRRLGPDILSAQTDAHLVYGRLRSERFCRRVLGGLYLDQGFLAGLGNYLRSEILFFARVHPWSSPSELGVPALKRLACNTVIVSRRSYKLDGITLPASQIPANTVPGSPNYERDRFAVFTRDGEPCRACDALVQRAIVTSRRLYWCPDCQAG